MISKQIVFTDINTVQIQNHEVPDPAAGQVQVRLVVSSISSGTERANLMGSTTVAWNRPELEKPIYPRYGGYSAAGIIEKVGEGVTKFAPGDKVALWWSRHDQVQNITENNVYKIDDVPFEDAALFHIATFPLAAVRKCRLEIGESAMVMGMGMLGILALQLLKAAGAVPVIAVDPDPAKREKALKCGADFALDPYDPQFAENAKKLTKGGVNVGIEVTGVGPALNGMLDCMARFGRVALLGCTRNSDFTVDYYRKVHGPGISLIGAHTMARPSVDSRDGWWSQKDDIRALKKLTELGRIHLAAMIDETHTPDEAVEVYHRLVTDKTFPLVQFDWRNL
jgi:2-desacetyl-2-hydroxyethyl bacteriochlorophyllide A dehydrogenase